MSILLFVGCGVYAGGDGWAGCSFVCVERSWVSGAPSARPSVTSGAVVSGVASTDADVGASPDIGVDGNDAGFVNCSLC